MVALEEDGGLSLIPGQDMSVSGALVEDTLGHVPRFFTVKIPTCLQHIVSSAPTWSCRAQHLTGDDTLVLIANILPLCTRRRGFWPIRRSKKKQTIEEARLVKYAIDEPIFLLVTYKMCNFYIC